MALSDPTIQFLTQLYTLGRVLPTYFLQIYFTIIIECRIVLHGDILCWSVISIYYAFFELCKMLYCDTDNYDTSVISHLICQNVLIYLKKLREFNLFMVLSALFTVCTYLDLPLNGKMLSVKFKCHCALKF